MLISESYRKSCVELHKRDSSYGIGQSWLRDRVIMVASWAGARTVLDYGAGKQTLAKSLPLLNVKSYDPGIPGIDSLPEPADLLVSYAVLEHIEPECLDAVLDDMRRCTLKAAFIVVSTIPSSKTLDDGRNAHLIIEPIEWWLSHIMKRWKLDSVISFKATPGIGSSHFKCLLYV